MKLVLKIILAVVSICLMVYLLLPSPVFPAPPPGSLQSNEPGDVESIYRRAFFTQLSRSEILDFYSKQFGAGIPFQILLNYPPEDAFTLVRDQTKSSWLQEFVHPFRESLYVNGFYPTKPTEQININGVHYVNKITLRYMPSHPVTRFTAVIFAGVCIYLLVREYGKI